LFFTAALKSAALKSGSAGEGAGSASTISSDSGTLNLTNTGMSVKVPVERLPPKAKLFT
jgi:hypothetical protein